MEWCNHYNCWCSDAEEITDGMGDCDYSCEGCEECEEIKPGENNEYSNLPHMRKYSERTITLSLLPEGEETSMYETLL